MEKIDKPQNLCADSVKRIDNIVENIPSNENFLNKSYVFKALSDTTRLKILYLLTDGELCVCELIYALNIPQSTASHHINVLKNAGLIESRKEGVWMHYRLSNPLEIGKLLGIDV